MTGVMSRRSPVLARWLGALRVGLVRSPGERILIVRMLAWRLAVAVLKRAMPIDRLVGMLGRRPPPVRVAGGPPRIVELAGAVCRPRLLRTEDNCLERSLIAYRYLCGSVPPPELVIGVRRMDGAVSGHAWVALAGEPLGEPPGALAGLTSLTSFSSARSGTA